MFNSTINLRKCFKYLNTLIIIKLILFDYFNIKKKINYNYYLFFKKI